MFCSPIGQRWVIFPCSILLLVRGRIYSHYLSSILLAVEYISMLCPPIGQRWSIFPCSVLLLVSGGVYSHAQSINYAGP
jgi:hypothetical protein